MKEGSEGMRDEPNYSFGREELMSSCKLRYAVIFP